MNNKNYEKYSNKGLTGMANIGNTCYLNSCLQLLSHTYELNDFLNEGTYKNKLNKIIDSVILLEWDDLNNLMWKENCTISPGRFVNVLQNVAKKKNMEIFSGYDQNDSSEFLLFLIDCFHNALSREVNMNIKGTIQGDKDKLATKCYEMMQQMYKKEYSEILNIFSGIQVTEITSLKNNKILSMKPEPFHILNLPIPNTKNPTLFECLDLYCEKEKMEGSNAWYNDETKTYENIEKGNIFWSLPNILVIDLKRFTNSFQKIQKLVNIPIENVNFTKYINGYDKEKYIYDLYGICNHSGNVLGGHYTCSIKNMNGKWYNYNDTIVKEIPIEKLITPQNYCLFYRKKNN